jgi:transcriptional regulator with XRE-family HTH domain
MAKRKKGPEPGTLYKNVKRTQLGMKIAALRRERGITQIELAQQAGLTKRIVSYYERESETIPSIHLQKFAQILRVPTDALLSNAPKMEDLNVNRGFLKRLEIAKQLPIKEQKIISDMIDSLAEKAGISKD